MCSSFASSVISAFSSRDTGQLALASSAISANCGALAPGTHDSLTRCTRVMAQLPPSCSSVTLACVAMRLGVRPARPRAAVSAIVKQPACAAAISSSGLVPCALSNRVANE
jgi:hypothetical protein